MAGHHSCDMCNAGDLPAETLTLRPKDVADRSDQGLLALGIIQNAASNSACWRDLKIGKSSGDHDHSANWSMSSTMRKDSRCRWCQAQSDSIVLMSDQLIKYHDGVQAELHPTIRQRA